MGLRLKQGREGRRVFFVVVVANFPAMRKTKQLFHGCIRIKVATVRFVCAWGGGGGGWGGCVAVLVRIGFFFIILFPLVFGVGDGLLC